MPDDDAPAPAPAPGGASALLVRGAALAGVVLGLGVTCHRLTGGTVPDPVVLGAVGGLALVVGVLTARASARWPARAAGAAGLGALALAVPPVLALLTAGPGAAPTLTGTHADHASEVPATSPGATVSPAQPPGEEAPVGAAAVDLVALRAAGVDLETVRAAGWDVDALVAAGLDGPALTAAGLDPQDPHAVHHVAGAVAALPVGAEPTAAPEASGPPSPTAGPEASGATAQVDEAPGGTAAVPPWLVRAAAAAATAAVALLLLAVPGGRRAPPATLTAPGRG